MITLNLKNFIRFVCESEGELYAKWEQFDFASSTHDEPRSYDRFEEVLEGFGEELLSNNNRVYPKTEGLQSEILPKCRNNK